MSDTPVLEVADIEVRFGGLSVLEGVSVTIEDGAVIGLIGPNGAGKTTLFNVISGFQPAAGGTVEFLGTDISRMTPHRRAALGIARTFQNPVLISNATVLENVKASLYLEAGYRAADLVLRPWRRWAGEAALDVRASDALEEVGLLSRAHDPVAELPFAQLRFVELACALTRSPSLVMMDEPTTGLDVAETESLGAAVERMRASGISVLVVAHDVAFVMERCDVVYVLAGGNVIAKGLPQDIQRDPQVVEAYLGTART